MDFKIGPRMVKTGLAVAIALSIVSYFGIELILVSAIAAVLAMQPSIMRSFNYIKEVLLSNSIAIILSLVGVYLLGNSPLSVGIIVILSIAFTFSLGWTKTTNLTVLTVLAMTIFSDDGFNFQYVIERISLVGVGVGSAFLVNAVIFPPSHRKILFDKIKKASDKATPLLRVISNRKMSIPLLKIEEDELSEQILKVEDYYKIVFDESKRQFKKNKIEYLRDVVIYRQMIQVLKKQNTLILDLEKRIDQLDDLSPEKSMLIRKMVDEINHYSENIMMMFEGKIMIIKDLQKESKNAMRITINNLILELQSSDFEDWMKVFPIGNGIIDLFYELDRLEMLVRTKAKRYNHRLKD